MISLPSGPRNAFGVLFRIFSVALPISVIPAARAVNFTWSSAANSSYSVATNWSGGTSPATNSPSTTASIATPTAFGDVLVNSGTAGFYLQNFDVNLTSNWVWRAPSATGGGVLTVTGTLVKSGAATLQFNNATSGVFNLDLNLNQVSAQGGVINFGASGTAQTSKLDSVIVSGSTDIESGATISVNSAIATFAAIQMNGGTMNIYQANATSSGGITASSLSGATGVIETRSSTLTTGVAAGTLTLTGASGTTSYSGQIADGNLATLTLLKTGNSTQTLGGSNTYSGSTGIAAGTLIVTSGNALGSATVGTVVSAGASLELNNVNYSSTEAVSISGTGSGVGGALANSGTSTFAGAITVASAATITAGGTGNVLNLTGGIVKNGTVLTVGGGGTVNVSGVGISGASANSDLVVDASTLILSATSTYNGPTTVQNGGVLQLGRSNVLPASPYTALALNTSGALDLAGNSDSVASLAGDATGVVTNSGASGTGTLTVNISSGTAVFQGSIQDGATAKTALTKSGAGAEMLGGLNSNTGNTMISAGSLLVSGSLSSSTNVTVAAGADLSVGKAAGALSFQTQTVSTLNLTALTGTSGGKSVLSLNLGAGGLSDELKATAGINISGSGSISLVLNLSGVSDLSGNYVLLDWGGGTALTAGQLDLTGSSQQILTDIANGSYVLGTAGTTLTLSAVAVPEPSAWVLLGLGLTVVCLRCRKTTRPLTS